MSNELENIIITIDSREQNQKRIKAVESWGERHGAIVEHSKLDHLDYRILGDFRGHSVSLGIEAKSLSQFCSDDYQENKTKLFNALNHYDEVALFIETGNYTFEVNGFGDTKIIQPAVRDGSANVCGLAVLEGCCSTLARYGIHVRQLRSEAQFPYSIENILTYITASSHLVVPANYHQTLLSFNTNLQTKKIMQNYPNLSWLCSASYESLKEVLGYKTGLARYDFLHDHSLETAEWKNNFHKDGTEKKKCNCKLNSRHTELIQPPNSSDDPVVLSKGTTGYDQGLVTSDPSSHPGTDSFKVDTTTPKLTVPGDINHSHSCDPAGTFLKKRFVFHNTPADDSHTPEPKPPIGSDADQQDTKVFHIPPQPAASVSANIPTTRQKQNHKSKQPLSPVHSDVNFLQPEETDIGLIGNQQEYKKGKDAYALSPKKRLKDELKLWFSDGQPHSLDVTVKAHSDWRPGLVHDTLMGGVKSKYLQMVADPKTNVIMFQKV